LDRRLGGPESWSGGCGEEKILNPTGTRTQPLGQPIASLYQLHFSSYLINTVYHFKKADNNIKRAIYFRFQIILM
jgi:hypothetical protein